MGVIQGISRSIINPLPGGIVSNRDSIQKRTIAAAFRSLDFSTSHADAFASWYITQNASLSGVVQDETPNRDHSRPELTCRATSFTTNQYFSQAGRTTSGELSSLTVMVWINTVSGAAQYALSEYGASDRVFTIGLSSGKIQVVLRGNAGGTKVYDSVATFNDGAWHLIGLTFNSGVLTVFCDGKEITVTKTTDNAFTLLNDATCPFNISSYNSGTAPFQGDLSHPAIWESALTAAEVRDLYLDKLDLVPEPDHAWLLDGDKAWTIAGDSVLSPSNTPTRLESEDNPKSQNDFNFAGYSIANNLMAVTEEFSSGTWNKVNVTIVDNDAIAPNGTTTADSITDSISTNQFFVYQNQVLVTDAGDYVFSVYLKSNGTQWAQVQVQQGESAYFDLVNGVVGNVTSGGTATISDEGNGWYRCSISGARVGNPNYIYLRASNGGTVYTGDGTNGVYAWGGQVVAGTEIPEYYPADVVRYDNLTVPAQWGSTTLDALGNTLQYSGQVARNGQLEGGTCFDLNGANEYATGFSAETIALVDSNNDHSGCISFDLSSLAADRVIFHNNVASGNRFNIKFESSDNTIRIGIDQSSIWASKSGVVTTGVRYKLVWAYDTALHTMTAWLKADSADYVELTGTSDPTTGVTFDRCYFGSSTAPNEFWLDKLYDFRIFATTLSAPSEIDTATKFRWWWLTEGGDYAIDSVVGEELAFYNSPAVGSQEEFFPGEHFGCNSVPVFVDPVELVASGIINMDGIKTASIEVDFLTRSTASPNTFYTQGFVAPFRLGFSGAGFHFSYRDDTNAVQSATMPMTYETDVLYRLKFDLVEDETNPTTASYATVSDRITGEVYGTVTGLNFAASTATSNYGPIQIGSYANATGSVDADIYRVRSVIGGVEKLLWTSENYLVNQTNDSAMYVYGGTLEVKKIPAKEDGSQTDVNGYPIQNTSPSHKNTQATLQGYLTNSDSEADIYYGASFDGVTSLIDISDAKSQLSIASDFSGSLDFKVDNGVGQTILAASNSLTDRFGVYWASGILRVGAYDGSYSSKSAVVAFADDVWHRVSWSYVSATDTLTAILDGVEMTGTSDPTLSSVVGCTVGAATSGAILLTGSVKNLVIDGGSTWPLYKDSLDRSSNCNHGTDTDVTYLNNPATEIAALNPTISSTETLAVTDGNKKLILLGQK